MADDTREINQYLRGNDTDPSMFIHTADLHLAPRSATISKRDPKTSRLIRDLDMENAFIRSVDATLSMSPLPSAYVVAGDIFDTYRGSSDAFLAVVKQFRRLRAAGIEVLSIAGNHHTPTNRLKTPMFEMLRGVFSNDEGTTLAYDDIEHRRVGDIEYVLLPHLRCLNGDFEEKDLAPTTDAGYAVLIVHGVAAGDPSLSQMDEVKEIPIAPWILDMGWDYIAFGHYHKPGWIHGREGKAAYSGSLENTVISGPDVCMRRGPVRVDMSKPATERFDMLEQSVRDIVVLPDIDVTGSEVNAEELDNQICELLLDSNIDGAIVRHTVRGVTRALLKSMSRRSFASVAPSALYIKTNFETVPEVEYERVADLAEKSEDGTADIGGVPADEGAPDDERGGAFRTLDGEVDLVVDQMTAKGVIAEHKAEQVRELLHQLLQ